MTRTEKRELSKEFKKREKILLTVNLLLIFATISSATFAYVVNDENNRIKKKIYEYNPDSKIYYLKQDIEGGKY